MQGMMISLMSGMGMVLVKMLMGVLSNPEFLEKTFLFIADKLAKHTSTDIDDKILELAKQALAHKESKLD